MKKNLIRFSLLIVLLAAAPQMSVTSASAGAGQNTNSSTMAPQPTPGPINPCRRKCMLGYRRCLHAAGNDLAKRKACAKRYRVCLRHCG